MKRKLCGAIALDSLRQRLLCNSGDRNCKEHKITSKRQHIKNAPSAGTERSARRASVTPQFCCYEKELNQRNLVRYYARHRHSAHDSMQSTHAEMMLNIIYPKAHAEMMLNIIYHKDDAEVRLNIIYHKAHAKMMLNIIYHKAHASGIQCAGNDINHLKQNDTQHPKPKYQ